MAAIPTNKNTLENRRVTFKRKNALPNSREKDIEIVSAVNRVLHTAGVPHHIRMGKITTNVRGTIMALATPDALADMLVVWGQVVVKAARIINQGIIDLEKNKTLKMVKKHGISFDQYPVQKSGGLEILRQEIQAENEGVVVPMAINWLARPTDIKQKKTSEEKQATSVVFSIKRKKIAQRCLEKRLWAAGMWHEVERYIHARPDTFCESCSG
jgi:hypothetical protein